MAFRLTFAGGAGTVTGSNFLVEREGARILVDCGIEQGRDFCQECMYAPFPYDVPSLDALVITHAHLDHIGRAPKLMQEGFAGRVYCTEATRDLMAIMLEDSATILANEARARGAPPLYRPSDVEALMARVETVPYHEERRIAPDVSIYLRPTGHILGSASVRITDAEDGTTLALTGDIGNTPNPYLPDWEPVPDADALVMESVYGDRLHPHLADRTGQLRDTLKRAIARGGAILMPSFSLERTQLMLYEISNLMEAGEIPELPVFLDSPLAIKATEVYERHVADFNPEAQEEAKRERSIFRFPFLTFTESREESMKIAEVPNPKLIIAGAGMSHGGRIGRWEQKYLPDPSTTLLIVGYQAPGSPGRMLQDGAPKVRIDGREVKLRAKVETLSAWSAHADRDGLMKFAEGALPRAKAIFVALGEPSSQRFLAQRIHGYLSGRAIVPGAGDAWEITKTGAKKL
jgi:metallo-beta-lactamase family protein